MTNKTNLNIWLAMVVFLLVLSGAARATDYYVSPDGNDSNSGTLPEEAWQTITRVNSEDFGPGDSIFFEGGQTFSGSLYFDANDAGTAANSVTVGSYGTGWATISSGSSKGLHAYNCAGFVIKDLIFVGSGCTDPAGDNGIFFNKQSGGIHLEYIRVDNVDVSGYLQNGIILSTNDTAGFKDVRITNAEVHDNGNKGIYVFKTPMTNWAHENIYVSDCKVYNIVGPAGSGIQLSGVDGAVVEFCETHHNGELNGGGNIGIWAYNVNDVVIQFNESHHNKTFGSDGGGFDLDGGCINSIIQYNYSHDNDGAGYGIYQPPDGREYKNNVVRYNISENDGLRGGYGAITFWATNSNGGIQDTQIYNNTLYVGPNTAGAGITDFAFGATYIYDTEVYNNIIVTVANKKTIDLPQTSGGWSFKGNCYWTYDDNIEINWGGAIYTSLAAWRAATGQETLDDNDVGFEADPCLVNPGGGGTVGDPCLLWILNDYRLKSSSPLIDAGLDVNTLFGIDPGLRDYYGTAIPVDVNYDVGAHEYDPNALPVARADNYSVSQDAVLDVNANLGVLANDYSVSGTLTAIVVSQPNNGSLTLDSNGAFDYDPNDTFAGTDSFTYEANDGNANSNIAAVYIDVFDPHPVANDDYYIAIEDFVLNVDANSGVLANDYSPGGPPNAVLVSQPNDGSLTLDSNGAFNYDPCAGFVGMDSFTYKASWGGYDSNVATVTINVKSNAPVANDDCYSTARNTVLNTDASSGVLANDVAYKGTLTAILVSGVSHGSLSFDSNGAFDYDPCTGFVGTDSFSYKSNDGIDDSNVATVYISVGSPVGWWKFEDGSGTTAENSGTFGNSHDGTLTNMDDSDWVRGVIGKSLEFDGSDDYVSIPALNLDSNTVTISAWIKRNGTQAESYTGIVVCRDANSIAGLSFGSAPDWSVNHELAYNWNDDQAAWAFRSGLIVPDNEWVFVAVVVEPTKATLYLAEPNDAPPYGYYLRSATNTLVHDIEEFDGITRIGHDVTGATRHFKGRTDEVRIYNYALSPAEIEQLTNPCDADFNRDGKVDLLDYAELAAAWMSSLGQPDFDDIYDLYDDDTIDMADFEIFSIDWLWQLGP